MHKIFVWVSLKILTVVAAWCYSKTYNLELIHTTLSWYLIANILNELASYAFVLPVWATSWHNPDNNKQNFVKLLNKFGANEVYKDFIKQLTDYMTAIPWS